MYLKLKCMQKVYFGLNGVTGNGNWTEIAVFLRNFLGDLSDVFTVHVCSARAQIQSLNSSIWLSILEGRFWESV